MSHRETDAGRSDLRQWIAGYESLPREVALYLAAARSVLEAADFATAARTVFDACKEMTGASAGYVALLSEDGAENEVLFLDAGGDPCTVDPELPMPIRGLRSESYRLNRAVYENDFMNSEWIAFMPEGHVVMRNVLFSPLIIDGKAVGLIGLANKDGDFTEDDAALATGFGELAALALRNAWTIDQVNAERAKAETYLNLSPSIILALDPDGRITLLNEEGERVLGVDPAEAIGMDWFETFLEPNARDEIHRDFDEFIRGRVEGRDVIEGNVVTRQGRTRRIIWHNTLIRDTKGSIQGTLSSGHDVTEQRDLEEQLVQRRRLDTLATLARGVAHEINNPIMGMMNYAELIASGDVDARSAEYARKIVAEGSRIATVIRSLLAFASEPTMEMRTAGVAGMIDRATTALDPLLRRASIDLSVRVDDDLPEIVCIPEEIERAILDLLLNALDALKDAPPSGERSIHLEATRVECPLAGECIQLLVRDTGIGMDEEQRRRSVDPFYTTKDRTARAGLGLASVLGVVEQHDGRLHIDSGPESGTVVTILLPVSKS